MDDLPDLVRPFAFLLGTWRGEGVGGYPTLEADFRYGEEITFACYGKPVIAFTSESWAVDDERPLARQSGFWRPTSATDLEVVLSVAAGLVEVFYGRLVSGPAGDHVELESDLIGHTATAKRVEADKRLYAVRGGKLMYAMEMAAVGQPMRPHLSAALDRVS
ncbi:MAG: hypothetical protein QOJ03_2888 [Frankiaceae bacterium]|jgi:hypothetical protein|nr:hypothetical protein [Frankiaceae bacterium]